MELRNEPKIGLLLGLRKVALIASVLTVLIFTGTFIYTNLSSSPDSNASVQSATNTITGKVFCDVDQDSTQDEFDSDLDGVKIWLFSDDNGNGQIDYGEDAIDSTTTSSSGSYSFTTNYTKGGSSSVTVLVSSDNDDAQEEGNGDVQRNGNNLKINDHTVAFRFKNVAMPQGATISSASVTMNSWQSKSGSASADIYGHAHDDSPSISSSDDDITDRDKTSAKVNWTLTDWGYGVDYATPDIKSIIQEIVNRNNWQSGNDITILIDKKSGGWRKVTTHDYNEDFAPKLNVSFELGSGINTSNDFVVKVDTSDYSGCSLVSSQTHAVSFNSPGNTYTDNNFSIANACGTGAKNRIRGKIFNDANKNGDLDPGEVGLQNVRIRLHCDRDGNGSLNSGDECMDSVDSDASGLYEFVVDYDSSSSGVSFSKKISNDNYDVEEDTDDGDVSMCSSDIDLGEDCVGLLFDNVTVPKNVTITSAHLRFRAEEDGNGTSILKIYAEDVDDASGFTYNDEDVSDRTRTSAYETWSMPTFNNGHYYNTPDLKDVIQEVVNRSGWSSGNDMTIITVPNSGNSDRDAYSREKSPSSAPELVINYTTGSGNENKFIVEIGSYSNGNVDEVISAQTFAVSFDNSGNQTEELESAVFDASALPVDLIYFYAEKQDKTAVLNWAKAMEKNSSHFEIQRSVDGRTFTRIDDEPGNGNTQNIIKYQYVDYDLPIQSEPVYYRLKLIDFDGQFEYSPIVYISDEEQSIANLYPNPASDFINISKQGYRFDAVILNRRGLEVVRKEGNMDRARFDVTTLPTGFYIVQIVSRTGEESYKVLVRH